MRLQNPILKDKIFSALIILVTFFFASFIAIFVNKSSILGILLYSIPVPYFILKNKNAFRGMLPFLVITFAVQLVAYYFAEVYGGWFVPTELPKVGYLTVQEILFSLLWPLTILIIYHNFFYPNEKSKMKMSKLSVVTAAFIMLSIIILHFVGFLESFRLYYIVFALIFSIPIIILATLKNVYRIRDIKRSILYVGIIFFVMSLFWEVMALNIDWWRFEGTYLMKVDVLNVGIPIEELIFWIVFGAPLVILFYEASRR